MPKPASDLEKYLAGESVDGQDVLPLLIVLVGIVLLVVALL